MTWIVFYILSKLIDRKKSSKYLVSGPGARRTSWLSNSISIRKSSVYLNLFRNSVAKMK